ncbi:alpha/beta fold hydrolase [Piscinibacter gummiphilus]|uniref:Alpha/beta hydrolase n=1 Tax=Piscinibacter gummiphilus TaxID=946333 RepID=A0A1W6LH77_9BURK|nr:alpha/beta hydrolase [Piscinibacter gummiphilus]ARN23589.1 alpha/beta hydrolase [Piscinibacter gummiphilus]ATU68298.1 alpha/beta hydrolase [Piscinibacter gummiphilus]GLS98188.1 lipase [Piscinibacter gummiphilus]
MSFIHKALVALALSRARRKAHLVRRTVRLDTGETYVYLDGGTGPTLLLLHGFGATKDNFTRVAALLTGSYRVVVPDHLGFGESDKPEHADYSPVAQARRLRTFVQALGLGAVDLGGNSMGGHIAMTYAALYPDDVRSLWLIDAGGVWSGPQGELQQHLQRTGRNLLVASTEDEFAEVFRFVVHKPPVVPKSIMKVLAQARIANLPLERRIFAQASADSVEDRVRGLPVPTLIVWGQEDRVFPPGTADVIHALLPNSEVVVLPEIGHLPMFEAPERCAQDYKAFRARL